MVLAVVVIVAFVNAKMHPDPKDVVSIDPKLLEDAPDNTEVKARKDQTPAEKLENSMVLSYIVVVIGAIYLIYYFVNAGSILNALSLNIVNLIFLILGIAFHKTPISYVRAITESAESAGGIILQFPFYAGIQGMFQWCISCICYQYSICKYFYTAYVPGTVLSGSWYCKLLRAVRRWTVGCSGSDHDACRSGAWCYTGSYCYGYRLG